MVYIITMIQRTQIKKEIEAALNRNRIVALVGPRQCGKTTIAREFVSQSSLNYFDLEDPLSLARLEEPMTGLKDLKGTIIIDEVQRKPELFPILRVLADRVPLPAKFLILGSASPELVLNSSESLAGRIEIIEMNGFSLGEIGFENHPKHWLRGGFPRSYLAHSDGDSEKWRKNFIKIISERDIVRLGHSIPSTTIIRFWTMLAHYHGRIWNAAELALSLGIGETSVRRYLDVLSDVFMVRQLQPWHANIKKRQVKAPKIYFRDTGLLHQLLGIKTTEDLLVNPKCGTSWEGYAMEELLRVYKPDNSYFWATHNKAEIDLLLVKNNRMIGIECKRSDAPKITHSMRIALEDLMLSKIVVIYPGETSYALSGEIQAVALKEIHQYFSANEVS